MPRKKSDPAPAATDLETALGQAAEPEPEPEPTPESEPEPSPEGGEEPCGGEGEPPCPEEAEDPKALLQAVDKALGSAFSKKYENIYEVLRGAHHAMTRLSQRDEDAEYGRRLREMFGGREEEIARILQAQQAGQPQKQQEEAPTWEQVLLMTQQAESDPTKKAKLEEIQQRYMQTLHRLTFEPDKVLQPYLDGVSQQIAEQAQQNITAMLSQYDEIGYLRDWAAKNADWLYEDGDPRKPLTPRGEEFCRLHDQAAQMGIQHLPWRLQYATEMMQAREGQKQAQQTPPPQAPKPKPQAVRKPALSGGPKQDKQKEYEEDLKTLSLEEHLAKMLGVDPAEVVEP